MADDATLTANTGQNDPNSVWGSGLLTDISGLATLGAGVYSTIAGKTGTPTQPPSTAPTSSQRLSVGSSWTQYLPWIGGAVILLIVIGFVFRRN